MSDKDERNPQAATKADLDVRAIESVRFNDLNRFLADKNAEHPCEACGRSVEWLIKTDDADHPFIHFLTNFRDPDNGNLFFSIMCPNCSNTRFFDAFEVARHLDLIGGTNGET
ncbi:hypothetical protein ACIPV9_11570 [Pseudomonas psychrophila]|uniref:hypothetical protein n=1 Tax=Pseudomonas psychrophila TaxID=122355 RepID=UPI003804E6BD